MSTGNILQDDSDKTSVRPTARQRGRDLAAKGSPRRDTARAILASLLANAMTMLLWGRYHYCRGKLVRHLDDFFAAYTFARRLNILNGLTPYEFICKR
jgi:hypothetical protein